MAFSKVIVVTVMAFGSLTGGIGLGGYAIGGFRVWQRPPDLLYHAAERAGRLDPQPSAPAMSIDPTPHVCTGCDAQLYAQMPAGEAEWSDESVGELPSETDVALLVDEAALPFDQLQFVLPEMALPEAGLQAH